MKLVDRSFMPIFETVVLMGAYREVEIQGRNSMEKAWALSEFSNLIQM